MALPQLRLAWEWSAMHATQVANEEKNYLHDLFETRNEKKEKICAQQKWMQRIEKMLRKAVAIAEIAPEVINTYV